jgi:UDP-GlcNAc3NAcA epimerase
MKIFSIFGARPQFVKAALVSQQLRMHSDVHEIQVNTGQHYDALMSDVFLQDLAMRHPDYNLAVGSGSHGMQTARMLERTEEVLLREKPDCVIVYGDTNSTLAGALAAAKLNIPLAHVEAGMRSFDRCAPEEHNRVITDHLADLLLTPSLVNRVQLLHEGIPESRIELVGDVMYDALLQHLPGAVRDSTICADLKLRNKGFVLCTIHRAVNTDDPVRLECLMEAITRVADHLPVVFPVHPRSRKAIESSCAVKKVAGQLLLIDPVGYLDMIALEKNAAVVATDSGGVQKEAFFLEVPCVTLRDETEWSELLTTGWNQLAPPNGDIDIAEVILSSIGKTGEPGVRPYGDGNAAAKICAAVLRLGGAAELINETEDVLAS